MKPVSADKNDREIVPVIFLFLCYNEMAKGGELMQITIEALEAYLFERYGGWGNELGLFMKLVEEMGEVAEVLNKRDGRKSADGTDLQKALGTELADMIHYIVAIAAINRLDLNDIILQKDRQASAKYNHEINLEEFIRRRSDATSEVKEET